MVEPGYDFPTRIRNRADRLGRLLQLRAPDTIIRNELGLLFRSALAHMNKQKVGKEPSSEEGLAWLKEILG